MAFVTVQVVDAVFPLLPLPESAGTLVLGRTDDALARLERAADRMGLAAR